MATSQEHIDPYDSSIMHSAVTTPRDNTDLKNLSQSKVPVQDGQTPKFFININREHNPFAHALLNNGSLFTTGRTNGGELSEKKRLNDRSSFHDIKKDQSEREISVNMWSSRNLNEDEGKDFTFVEEKKSFRDGVDIRSDNMIILNLDSGRREEIKKDEIKPIQEVEEENIQKKDSAEKGKKDGKKKKKKKTTNDPAKVKKQSNDSTFEQKSFKEDENFPKVKRPRKSQYGPRREDSEEEMVTRSSVTQLKKKTKERDLRQTIAKKQEILHNELQHEVIDNPHHGSDALSGDSINNSPRSFVSSNKENLGFDEERRDSFDIVNPKLPRVIKQSKTKKKSHIPTEKAKKREKLYLEGQIHNTEKKVKRKKHHTEERLIEGKLESKDVLLTDGLNLVKLMTDRKNCKKTKALVILFTLTVLWSIVLNGLELAFLIGTGCKVYTELGTAYLCFSSMMALKLLCITLFNLELTFKQPYKPVLRSLYPFLAQLFCPMLQLPQNLYDFDKCEESNKILTAKDSWQCLHIIIGCLAGIMLYVGLKQKVNFMLNKSRLSRIIDRFFMWIIGIIAVGWNLLLIILFCSQKQIFLPSFFFDFYIYLMLGANTIIFYLIKKKIGEHGLQNVFVKTEKEENELLKNEHPQEPSDKLVINVH